MARIGGVNVPDDKHLRTALTYIYGIGLSRASEICQKASTESTRKISDLTPDELERVRVAVGEYVIEGDLRREVQTSIKRLMDLGDFARHPSPPPPASSGPKNANQCTDAQGATASNQTLRDQPK